MEMQRDFKQCHLRVRLVQITAQLQAFLPPVFTHIIQGFPGFLSASPAKSRHELSVDVLERIQAHTVQSQRFHKPLAPADGLSDKVFVAVVHIGEHQVIKITLFPVHAR